MTYNLVKINRHPETSWPFNACVRFISITYVRMVFLLWDCPLPILYVNTYIGGYLDLLGIFQIRSDLLPGFPHVLAERYHNVKKLRSGAGFVSNSFFVRRYTNSLNNQ